MNAVDEDKRTITDRLDEHFHNTWPGPRRRDVLHKGSILVGFAVALEIAMRHPEWAQTVIAEIRDGQHGDTRMTERADEIVRAVRVERTLA